MSNYQTQNSQRFLALVGLLTIGLPHLADADTCSIPAHPAAETTGDTYHYGGWACRREWMDYFRDHYDMDDGDWDNGFGAESPCDVGLPLARSFNAIHALHYSAADPPRRSDDYAGSILRWGGNYAMDHIDELDARCSRPNNYAWTVWGPIIDNYTQLFLTFFYDEWPVERAATLLHESRHAAWVGHDADDDACPRHGSCDSRFSPDGVNTWQVLWLWWFSVDAQRVPAATRDKARDRANAILATAFAEDPGFRIDAWGAKDPCYDWGGQWQLGWDSASGRYQSAASLWQSGAGVGGRYANGELSASASGANNHLIDGAWKRTSGNSGGSCQYGNFHLEQSFDAASNRCVASGWWDYCGSGTPKWSFTGVRVQPTH